MNPFLDFITPSREGVAQLQAHMREKYGREISVDEAEQILSRMAEFLWHMNKARVLEPEDFTEPSSADGVSIAENAERFAQADPDQQGLLL